MSKRSSRKRVDKARTEAFAASGGKQIGKEQGIVATRGTNAALRYPIVNDDLVDRKGFAVYEDMRTDPSVKAGLAIKVGGILSKGWGINPYDASAEAKTQADFIADVFDQMPGSIDEFLESVVSDGLADGTGIAERIYSLRDDKKIGLAALKPKNPDNYDLKLDDFNNITQMLNTVNVPTPVDISKFVIFTYLPRYGQPWGTSDLRAAYRYYWGKTKVVQWWLINLEKHAMPVALGKVPPSTPTPTKEALATKLDALKNETSIVYEEGTEIEYLLADQSASAQYITAIKYFNEEIIKAILGNTLTTGEGARFGSMALGKVHQGTQNIYLRTLKRTVEEFMTEQIIRPLIDLNYPNRVYPRFVLRLTPEDIDMLATTMSTLVNAKVVRPRESWIREYLQLPEEDESSIELDEMAGAKVGNESGSNPTSSETPTPKKGKQ